MKKDLRIKVTNNEELHVHLTIPDGKRRYPVVILSHGFSVDGTESHRLFIHLANELYLQNYICVNFDYRGTGYSDGLFEDLTMTQEIEDLKAVLNFTKNMPNADKTRIGVVGQSTGSIAAIAGLWDAEEIRVFVLWGIAFDIHKVTLNILGEKGLSDMAASGIACLPDKGYYIKRNYLDDLKKYCTADFIKKINKPIVFIHAEADTVVPIAEVQMIFKIAKQPKHLEIIKNGLHSYKCQIDLEKQAIAKTLEWLKKYL